MLIMIACNVTYIIVGHIKLIMHATMELLQKHQTENESPTNTGHYEPSGEYPSFYNEMALHSKLHISTTNNNNRSNRKPFLTETRTNLKTLEFTQVSFIHVKEAIDN
ncbi:hypothetical protein JTB14_029854 [Gonioctena quinquepunctata]|nr:hypothetical protein JTB14_029854 [Gonioctena quinquepunctata]